MIQDLRIYGLNIGAIIFSAMPNTWYHLALVVSGSSYEGFINGVSFGTATNNNYTSSVTQTAHIGSYHGSNYYWSGEISDAKFFDKALTSAEVTAQYNIGYNGIG